MLIVFKLCYELFFYILLYLMELLVYLVVESGFVFVFDNGVGEDRFWCMREKRLLNIV